MMFARAIGDTNPIYADADYAATTEVGAIIAPPTFPQSSVQFHDTYVLRPTPGQYWLGSGQAPSGSNGAKPTPSSGNNSGSGSPKSDDGLGQMANTLHAEQHFEYKRPLRAGEALTSRSRAGEGWEKQNRAGKTLKFSEQITEFLDQGGDVVALARSVSVNTGG
jgi:hypothetical protein